MNTENLNAGNVKVLDVIINLCVAKGGIRESDLPDLPIPVMGDLPEIKANHYRPYVDIIADSQKAKVIPYKGGFQIDPINGITREFKNDGGFQQIFNDLQAKIADDKIVRGKNKDDAEIARFNRERLETYDKRSKWSFGLSIAAVIIALLSLFIGKM